MNEEQDHNMIGRFPLPSLLILFFMKTVPVILTGARVTVIVLAFGVAVTHVILIDIICCCCCCC